jgi:hypothetical protein
MTVPGFSAEKSLYKMAAYYRLATMWSNGAESYLSPAQFCACRTGKWRR